MDSDRATIVAVDDQPPILRTIIAELQDIYHVKAFSSGRQLLTYLERLPADLILLDYNMPGMNGLEILEHLHADPRFSGIPVVFLTSSQDRDAEAETLARGASDYIQKPISARVLLSRVSLQLELKRYQNHLEALVAEQTRHLHRINEKLKRREDITLNLLAEVTDLRDHDTGGHIRRTTEISRILVMDLLKHPAPGYTLSGDEADDIIRSAKLHDLGKIAVPDTVLLKPGALDEAEREVMKLHPHHGAGLLEKYIEDNEDDPFLETARDIARYHHEKWNGSGYPDGLSGEEIPLAARITALADVYDALTSARPYKKPFSHEKSVAIIRSESGAHFDPYLVEVFLHHEKEIAALSRGDERAK